MSDGGEGGPDDLIDPPEGETPIPPDTMRKELETALETVPHEKRETIIEQVMTYAESYRGALPHPKHFAAYGDTLPTAPERLLQMVERQQEHQHKIESGILRGQRGYARTGQIIALLVMVLLIGAATYCIAIEHNNLGGAIFLGTVACGVVVSFLRGQISFTGLVKSNASHDDDDDEEKEPLAK